MEEQETTFDVILREKGSQGAFYEVIEAGNHLMWVATHTYGENWDPKTSYGTYTCKRGLHTIPTGESFNTFEVMNVPGHKGILFVHPGNLPQKDSDGCFICGKTIGYVANERAVIMSRDCFENVFTPRIKDLASFKINLRADDGLEN